MDIRHIVGNNIKELRKAAGLSQEELAARMDVDQAYISRLEAGEKNPTILTLWHAAQALSCKTESFFKETL